MCVAIYKPEGVQLHKRDMLKCFHSNSDGVGFSYIEDGIAKIHKGFFRFKEFWTAFREHHHKECIVHFRWATHGVTDADNCHPFVLANHGALIHNGIIDWATSSDPNDTRSDTRIFVEDFINPMIMDGVDFSHMGVRKQLEQSIGATNKVILFSAQDVIILNQQCGSWHKGAWFSNLHWQAEASPWNRAIMTNYTRHAPKGTRQYVAGVGYRYTGYDTGYDMLDRHYDDDVARYILGGDEEEEETEHKSLFDNIYSQCRVCFAWKHEESMLNIGQEPICQGCFDREYEIDHPLANEDRNDGLSDHPYCA